MVTLGLLAAIALIVTIVLIIIVALGGATTIAIFLDVFAAVTILVLLFKLIFGA